MKRFSVLLLYLVAFVCLLNAKVIKGECGTGMTWSFDTDKGILAFSGSGPMYDYPNVTPWNLYKNDVKTVVLAKNVTDMPYYALKGCLSIETIKTEDGGNFFVEGNCLLTKSDSTLIFAAKNFSIPSSTRIIGAKSFYENPSLQTLTIPEGVVTIAEQAFAKCTALKTVSMPSTVRKVSIGAFYGCLSLASVDLPKEGLVNIGKQSFAKCVSLKEINIPTTVKIIGLGAFAKCSSIESVTIPSSTELINMGAFQDCTGLKSLTIEEGVKMIGEYAFQTCSSLTSVLVPASVIKIFTNSFDDCKELNDLQVSGSNTHYYSMSNKIIPTSSDNSDNPKTLADDKSQNTSKQTGIKWSFDESTGKLSITGSGRMEDFETKKMVYASKVYMNVIAGAPWYSYRDKVKSVDIAEGITYIGSNAFKNFTLLNSVTLPDSLANIAYSAFNGCSNLSQINIDSENKFYFSEGNCLISIYDSTLVLGCSTSVIPNYVKVIGSGAFLNNSQLKSIALPDGLIKIGKSAFEGCTSLSEIDIPESVYKMDATAFYGCNALPVENAIRYAGNWAVGVADNKCKTYIIRENTIGLSGTFSFCSNLESICLPEGLKYIDDGAFSGCTSLSDISIAESVIKISSTAFKGCKKLPKKNNVLYAGNWAVDVADSTLAKYKLQENTVGLAGTFARCKNLNTINIPQSVKIIGEKTFYECPLTKIKIPNSVEYIGDRAFERCPSLTEINIPNSVRYIGDLAFSDCSSLRKAIVPDSLEYVGWEVFLGCSQLGRKMVGGLICYEIQSTDILFYVTANASFPGGDAECMNWLRKNIKYPAICQEQGVQGMVILSFVVDRDGSVVDVKVVRSPDEHLSEEAVRLVKLMPKWKPAVEKGKIVRTRFNLPIMFRLG